MRLIYALAIAAYSVLLLYSYSSFPDDPSSDVIVVYATSESYAEGTACAMDALFKKWPEFFHLSKTFVLTASEEEARDVRYRMREHNASYEKFVRTAKCPCEFTSGWIDAPLHYRYLRASPTIWLRFCIVDSGIAESAQYALYMDADTKLTDTAPKTIAPLLKDCNSKAVCGVSVNRWTLELNTGVLLFNISDWRENERSKHVKLLYETWQVKDDTALLNSLYERNLKTRGILDPRWNVMGLGEPRVRLAPSQLIDRAYILHWTGPKKHWYS